MRPFKLLSYAIKKALEFTPANLPNLLIWYDPSDGMDEKIAFRRNLLTWTERLHGGTPWSFTGGGVLANIPGGSPLSGFNACQLTDGVGITGDHRLNHVGITFEVGTYTLSAYAKRAPGPTGQPFRLTVTNFNNFTASFNVDTGVPGAISGAGATSAMIDAGGGWWLCSLTFPAVVANSPIGLQVGGGTYVGTGQSIYMSAPQLEKGASRTTYQPLTDFNTEFMAAFPTHTMFQDLSVQAPVYASGQPLGLMLDKSQGLAMGPVTASGEWSNAAPSFDFDTFTSDGTGGFTAVKSTAGGTDVAISTNTIPLVVGEWWLIEAVVAANTMGNCSLRIGVGTNSRVQNTDFTGTGTIRRYVQVNSASGVNGTLSISTGNTGSITVTSMTMRRIYGNHLPQATAAARPQYVFEGGKHRLRYNGITNHLRATLPSDTPQFTVFALFSNTTLRASGREAASSYQSNLGWAVGQGPSGQTRLYTGTGGSFNTDQIAGTFVAGELQLAMGAYDGANSIVRRNSGARVITPRTYQMQPTNGIRLGQPYYDVNAGMDGDMGVVVFLGSYASENDQDNMVAYTESIWGTLP
jgi:hypothetical protein